MTDELLKPEKASFASSTPVTYRTPMAPKNTISARNFVNNSTVNIENTVTIVIQAYKPKPKNSIVSIYIYSFFIFFVIGSNYKGLARKYFIDEMFKLLECKGVVEFAKRICQSPVVPFMVFTIIGVEYIPEFVALFSIVTRNGPHVR